MQGLIENIAEGRRVLDKTQSPVEFDLAHVLLKAYEPNQIQNQFRVGNYRLDFLTSDGIGWEVDGKRFHDAERDTKRDKLILRNSDVQRIVRIQAAAIMFFRDACMAVFSKLSTAMSWCSVYCELDRRGAIECADEIVEPYSLNDSYDALRYVQTGEAYSFGDCVAHVGCPLSFVPLTHRIWKRIPTANVGRCLWQGEVRWMDRDGV